MKKTILITLLLVFGMFNNVSAAGILLDRIVVIIDKEVITWSELYKTMEFELRKDVALLDNKERAKYLNQYSDLFLERMIDMKIQLMYAARHGISVAPQEIDATIADISSKNSMSVSEFQKRVIMEGFDWDDYKDMMSKQLLVSKVVRTEVRNKVVVPEEKISEYLIKNPLGTKSASVRIRQIVLLTKDNKTDKINLAHDIYSKIKSGVDFQSLAQQYSQASNAKNGGDLGYVALDDVNAQYKTEINKLMIGQTSLPFETTDAITLIQLVDRKDAPSSKQARDEIKEKLFGELFDKAHKDWIKTLKEKTYMEILL